jgi:hypothetical protein
MLADVYFGGTIWTIVGVLAIVALLIWIIRRSQ